MTVFHPERYELHLAQRRRAGGGLVQWGSRNGPAVKALQEKLTQLGYATEVDGQWGKETEASFRAFQHSTGLRVDGKLGPKSLDGLLKAKPKDRNAADTGLDAIQKVVAPGMSQASQRTSGLGQIKAQQHGGGAAAPRGARSGSTAGGRAGSTKAATKAPPKGAHGGRIDPVTGAEVATSTTGPIGTTDPTKAHTPRQPQDNNPEFNKLHPREGGKFAAKQGDSGEHVTNTQEALNRTSKAGLATDGQFGPKTDAAVKSFQKKQGLAVDGIVGPKTSGALRRALHAAKAKPAVVKRPPR